ncbi:uncharacterized protein LOC133198655 [Saccostrea echinata]|uniref:uncharacterized protein LOC133198655 n=1 Tax=Saccostrea echinata TaxID=191078 RepID=UPI002A811AAF|nr:uncharacterized protein LOC133198655 [Saccostrea echinata]
MARRKSRLQLLISGVLIFCIAQLIDAKWNFLNIKFYLSKSKRTSLPFTRKFPKDSHSLIKKSTGNNTTPYHGEPLAEKSSDHPDFRIIVIVFNRPHSLERLLDSLNKAEYFEDKVILEVWIDRSKKDGTIHDGTYHTASRFKFYHGEYRVHNHTKHVGIYGQWIGTWNPAPESEEIVVILEDDLTVSKHFYRWLKNVHKKYDSMNNLAGYALQGRSIKHGGAPGDLRGPEKDVCFLYPILGTWGYSPHRKNWFHFVEWYRKKSTDPTFQPLVPGILPTQWWKIFQQRGKTEGMWSMWYIYHAWNNKLWTLYPNLRNSQGLTINWKESGLHYKQKQTAEDKTADPILQEWIADYDFLPGAPAKLDVNGKILHFKVQ